MCDEFDVCVYFFAALNVFVCANKILQKYENRIRWIDQGNGFSVCYFNLNNWLTENGFTSRYVLFLMCQCALFANCNKSWTLWMEPTWHLKIQKKENHIFCDKKAKYRWLWFLSLFISKKEKIPYLLKMESKKKWNITMSVCIPLNFKQSFARFQINPKQTEIVWWFRGKGIKCYLAW